MLDILFVNRSESKQRLANQSQLEIEDIKKDSNNFASAYTKMMNEKDPQKYLAMRYRINNGIYDFSDL